MNLSQFNHCVDVYADGLYRFANGIVSDRAAAQDVVQETFLKFWINRRKVERGKERSYLFTIAYRDSISALRGARVRQVEPLQVHSAMSNEQWDNTDEIVWRAIDALSQDQRSAVMLRDWEGYSYDEIAQIMQVSLAQVKITIHRARTALKVKLSNEYQEI